MANESALSNSVPEGRLGVTTLTTAYGVILAGTTATGAVQNAGVGTTGQILTSNGAAANPSFQANPLQPASQAEQETGTATDVFVSSGRQQYHISAGKVHCRWHNVTGVPTLDSSYNVSSLTDTGAGVVTINFTTNFSNSDYCVVSIGTSSPSNLLTTLTSAVATSSCAVNSKSCDTPYALADQTDSTAVVWGVLIFGDQ